MKNFLIAVMQYLLVAIILLAVSAYFVLRNPSPTAEEVNESKAKLERIVEIEKKKERLLKQEALLQRNTQWDALNAKDRVVFRKNEYKNIADSLVSSYPGQNVAMCYHAGFELFGKERSVRQFYLAAFQYDWMNEVLFNKVMVEMYAKISELPQREDHDTKKIVEIFYNENCR
jgi:hypothetical protein